ncbi:CRAL-TRIO domain-containing protein [Lyophyllum atratum]|nr:CRAL-TRIO domain-containing protein [Lyophyllum atratum]
MSTTELLRENCERLLVQYNSNIQAVLGLQATLIRDILPSVTDELELSPEATEWAKEWLEDTHTLFRICRRNNFTRSFAMESIRKNLVWRLRNLWPLGQSVPIPMLHCLPENAHDPFGRPILLLEVLPLDVPYDAVRPIILQTFERLRRHLNDLRASPTPRSPILQYIVLLDLQGFSMRSFDLDLLTWITREIIPQFPGMLAGVFMLNYSWVHSGMWNLVKRVLPASALSRVFFPSDEELIQFLTPSSLPKDYGGALPALKLLEDPLRTQETPLESLAIDYSQTQADDPPSASQLPASTSLSPTSLLNPFFGYPASSSYGSLSLPHGRRRKRDLARTLALLFWIRWRKPLVVGLLLAVCAIILKLGTRRAHVRSLRSFLKQKLILLFKFDPE